MAIFLAAPAAQAQSVAELSDEIGITPRIGETIPQDLVFNDSKGRGIRFEEFFRNQPVLLMPVYYRCPMLCGMELNGVVRCLRAMELQPGRDFQIVTYSIDPKEVPQLAAEKKATYIKSYGREGAASGWHFLTGDEKNIQRLNEAIGFKSQFDPKTGQYAHAAGVVLVTPRGTVARYLYGVDFAPRDLRLALVETSKGQLSSLSDHVLLLCYAFDPTRGKYGLAIHNALRVGGGLTVLGLASAIGILLWRERKSGNPSLSPQDKQWEAKA